MHPCLCTMYLRTYAFDAMSLSPHLCIYVFTLISTSHILRSLHLEMSPRWHVTNYQISCSCWSHDIMKTATHVSTCASTYVHYHSMPIQAYHATACTTLILVLSWFFFFYVFPSLHSVHLSRRLVRPLMRGLISWPQYWGHNILVWHVVQHA